MGMMERVKGWFSGPSSNALGVGQNTRDAARADLPEFSGWTPPVSFAGTTYGQHWNTIAGRARDLDENNGWINGGLDRRVESVIGENIRPSAQPEHTLLNRDYAWRMAWTGDVQARWKIWANDIEHRNDARQRLTFGAQARLAYLTYARDGVVAAEIRDSRRGLRNTTNVLLVEPERISTPPELVATEGRFLRDGIRFDANGAPIGYWVRNGHPNDPTPNIRDLQWTYVPARGRTGRAKFLHVFSPRRVEQNTGVSRLAEVMLPSKMLDRVDRAEVHAALKAAIFSLFIKAPGRTEDIESALAPSSDTGPVDSYIDAYLDMRSQKPVMVDNATVTHLLPDEDVVAPASTHPNSNFPDFARYILQKVSSSLGMSYPQVSQDYAGINYSSARVLLNEVWRGLHQDRHYFCQHFLTPIWAAWLEMEVANGDIKVPGGPANFYRNKTAICMVEWIGPGRGSVDPKKESDANNQDIAAGRKSAVQCILEDGRDPVDIMAEESWFLSERAKRGLGAPNNNVKPDQSAESEDGSAGGSEDDRDGDGVPNEDGKRRKKQDASR